MDKNSILAFNNKESVPDVLNALLREGAQQLIHRAVESELSEYLSQHQHFTADGRIAVVRNGYLPKREILTGIGPVSVRIPKVRSRDGEPITFRSALVPPYVRKTRSLEAALPWLYLKGVSTGEMGEALKVLVGHDAQGLSASTVSRLKSEWAYEYQHWREKPLDKDRWVYIWADGIYTGLRSEKDKLCALVIIGVNERGQKQFLAIEDGVRESTQSWREVLLKLKSRGMNVPQLAIGDGAMGFWLPWMKYILRHVSSVVGYTKQQISLTLCPKAHSLKLKRRYIKYGRQRLKSMQRKPLNSSLKPIRTNTQRPPFRSRKIVKSYWPFMISLLNTGRVYEPATRLDLPLGLLGTEPKEPKAVSIVMGCCT